MLPDFQWGFRPYRGCVGPIFLLRVVLDLATRCELPTEDGDVWDALELLLVDIKKSYLSVPREAAYRVLANAGLPQPLIQVPRGLHDHTEYVVQTREGASEPSTVPKGFREGCRRSFATCTTLLR